MNKKLFLYLFIALAIAGCKNNFVKISGTLTNPASGNIYLS